MTSFLTAFLGLWEIAAPFTLGYPQDSLNSLICGLILIISGWVSRNKPKARWLSCFVGLWLQLAPLVFWAKSPAAYSNDTFVGLLAILFAIIIPGIPGFVEKKGPTIPPGWSYNPSSYAQRLPIILLATFAWFTARYLAAYQLGYITTVWDPFFGDGTLRVITSSISKSFPVPDAGLGAFAYSLEVLLACKGSSARWRTMPWLVIFFGILVVPVGIISIILIILQPLAVGAWCGLCLMIAIAMLLMVALTLDEILAVWQLLKRTKKQDRWMTFWKGASGKEEPNRDPPLTSSCLTLLKAGFKGCSLSWRLVLSFCLGIFLVSSPSFFSLSSFHAHSNQLIGPLVIATAFITLADVAKKASRLFFLFGAYILFTAFFPSFSLNNLYLLGSTGLLLILMSRQKCVV